MITKSQLERPGSRCSDYLDDCSSPPFRKYVLAVFSAGDWRLTISETDEEESEEWECYNIADKNQRCLDGDIMGACVLLSDYCEKSPLEILSEVSSAARIQQERVK